MRVALIPQAYNTGLVGAASPNAWDTQGILSLSRLNRGRAVDPFGIMSRGELLAGTDD